MATILKITNGEDTINLNDGVNYGLLKGWVPRVARRRVGEAAGRSLYEDVTETIPIRIFGESEADALSKLQAIGAALNDIQEFANGAEIDPWVIQYQPNGSALADPVQALIVGAGSANDLIQLPATFNEHIRGYEISPVYIPFTRRGLWLGETQTDSVTTANNPHFLHATHLTNEDLKTPGPTQIKITGFDAGTDIIEDAYILITDAVLKPSASGYGWKLFDYSDMSSSEFSNQADSANKAINDNVKRIDAASNQTGSITVSMGAQKRAVFVFVAVRNNSSTIWQIRAVSTAYSGIATRWQTIDASTSNPRIISLGQLVSTVSKHEDIDIEVQTEGSTGTLDVGHIVIISVTPYTHVLGLFSGSYSSAAYERLINLDPRALTALDPIIGVETS